MYELHKHEQYFFDEQTLDHLARFAAAYSAICCLCAPLLGQALEDRGIRARVLDIDTRFNHLRGFQHYDIYRPEWLGERFDLIICDPPFFKVSLSQLFHAVRMISQYDYTQPLLICYLARRASNVIGTFSPFGLVQTGYHPNYQTVQSVEQNDICVFGNLSAEEHDRLSSGDAGDRSFFSRKQGAGS